MSIASSALSASGNIWPDQYGTGHWNWAYNSEQVCRKTGIGMTKRVPRYPNFFMYRMSRRTIRTCRRQKCRAIIVTIEISECCKHLGSSGRKIMTTISFGRFCKHGICMSPNFFILIFKSLSLCCLPSDDLGGATTFYGTHTKRVRQETFQNLRFGSMGFYPPKRFSKVAQTVRTHCRTQKVALSVPRSKVA